MRASLTGAFVLTAVAIAGIVIAAQHLSDTLFCKTFPAAGTYWIALPAEGPIETAEQLCAAIGETAVRVEELGGGAGLGPHELPHDDTVGQSLACGGACNHPGAFSCGGSSSSCFCVDPGEGFQVVVDGPSTLQLLGADAPVTISLEGPGSGGPVNLISLPFDTPVQTAAALADGIGYLDIDYVVRYLPAFDFVYVYQLASPDFLLVPGESYVVSVKRDVEYTPPPPAGVAYPSCNEVCNTYLIEGTPASGSTWHWRLHEDGGSFCAETGVPVTFPGDATTLRDDFVSSIAGDVGCQFNGAGATAVSSDFPLFEVCYGGPPFGELLDGPPRLHVPTGTPAGPGGSCAPVNHVGCSYNPVVSRYIVPPGVPDGIDAPGLIVSKLDAEGTNVEISWSANGCREAEDHHLIYGMGSQLPAVAGGTYGLTGALCALGTASPGVWHSVPDPAVDVSRLLWFLILANDGMTTEGSWGHDGEGAERHGLGPNGASATCGMLTKSLANPCGQ